MGRHTKKKLSQALQEYGIRALFYVTHSSNLPSILQHGILCRNEMQRNKVPFTDISERSVQWLRKQRWRYDFDPHDFVPLFFADNTPMLYVCWQRHPDEVMLLEIDPRLADQKGVIFSDGNIAASGTQIYSQPEDLEKLDWQVILSRHGAWSKEWKRKRAAELLVPDKVPIKFIRCVHMSAALKSLPVEFSGQPFKITVKLDLKAEGVM